MAASGTVADEGWIEAHEILQTAVFKELKPLIGQSFPLQNAFGGFKWHLHRQNRLKQLRAIARDRGILESEYTYTEGGGMGRELPPQDQRILTEILSSLIRQGILVLGPTIEEAQSNYYTISRYGEDCLQSGEVIPHDPEGYVALLKARVPALDSVIVNFIEEACYCFTNSCYKASAVMCGVASERLINLFSTQLLQSISNPSHPQAKKLQNALRRPWKISDLEAVIRAILSDGKNVAGWPLTFTELQRFIFPTFAWIKVNRDSSGHPSNFQITRIEMRAQLMTFIVYAEKFSILSDYLTNNKISLV